MPTPEPALRKRYATLVNQYANYGPKNYWARRRMEAERELADALLFMKEITETEHYYKCQALADEGLDLYRRWCDFQRSISNLVLGIPKEKDNDGDIRGRDELGLQAQVRDEGDAVSNSAD